MINSRFALFLLLIIPSYLISQSILDRFNVPIYITSSLSTGYDSNIFRLSDAVGCAASAKHTDYTLPPLVKRKLSKM